MDTPPAVSLTPRDALTPKNSSRPVVAATDEHQQRKVRFGAMIATYIVFFATCFVVIS